MTKITASIRPTTFEEGEDLILSAQIAEAEMIELWCDRIPLEDAKKLVVVSELPVIVNLKGKEEKGDFEGSIFKRIQILEELINQGAAFLDLPFSEELLQTDLDRLQSKLILSYHDFKSTPSLDEMENIINKMLKLSPAYIKLALTVNQEIDLMNIFKLQANRRDLWGKCILLGMGPKGVITRVISSMFKHPFTFASIDKYSKTAPGQMTITGLRKVWKQFGLKE